MILLQNSKGTWLQDLLSQRTPRGKWTRLFIHSSVNMVILLIVLWHVSGPAGLRQLAANFQSEVFLKIK